MNDETKLRMAASLIQQAKNYLSPMNDENPILWGVTCDLENARITIDNQIKKELEVEERNCTESQRQVRCTIPTCAMKYEELEKARREFMEGKRTAESYWSVFRCYWSQFKEEGK